MNEKKPRTPWVVTSRGMAISLLIVLVAHGVYAGMVWWLLPGPNDHGTFGDLFGGTNSLFSGLAFVGVVVALILQRQEIETHWEEMREEKKHTATQDFENRFFHLLSSLEDVVTSAHLRSATSGSGSQSGKTDSHTDYVGRAAFILMADVLHDQFLLRGLDPQGNHTREQIAEQYDRFFRFFACSTGHYFRLLYHIVRSVDGNKGLTEEEKQDYIRILRAHLSQSELYLLFYNGLSEHGNEKFHPLLCRYNVLHNIDLDSLAHPSHAAFYPGLAEGEGGTDGQAMPAREVTPTPRA